MPEAVAIRDKAINARCSINARAVDIRRVNAIGANVRANKAFL
jgi:hypothetical protein